MKKRFISFILLISVLALNLMPTNAKAQSVDSVEQELHKTVENLNLQNLKLEIIPTNELPKDTNTLNFETIEEFESFMINLDKESMNKTNEDYDTESRIEHFRDGKWVEIDQKEYDQIINNENIDKSLQLSQPSGDAFADYFKKYTTLIDKTWAATILKMKVESYVNYGIEKVAPRAKFAVSDKLYPIHYSGTELRNEEQSVTPKGSNHETLQIDWYLDVYAKMSVGGFEVGMIIEGYEGVYYIK